MGGLAGAPNDALAITIVEKHHAMQDPDAHPIHTTFPVSFIISYIIEASASKFGLFKEICNCVSPERTNKKFLENLAILGTRHSLGMLLSWCWGFLSGAAASAIGITLGWYTARKRRLEAELQSFLVTLPKHHDESTAEGEDSTAEDAGIDEDTPEAVQKSFPLLLGIQVRVGLGDDKE